MKLWIVEMHIINVLDRPYFITDWNIQQAWEENISIYIGIKYNLKDHYLGAISIDWPFIKFK